MLAAHVLGGVDFEEKGNAGIEKALDAELRGNAGRDAPADRREAPRHRFRSSTRRRAPGVPLTLTIDERLQFVAERELAAAVAEHDAVSGSVVVMNPYNGEILALASYPTVRSQRAAGARARTRARAESGAFGAVRAGLGVQGDHAFGRARDHQPHAR